MHRTGVNRSAPSRKERNMHTDIPSGSASRADALAALTQPAAPAAGTLPPADDAPPAGSPSILASILDDEVRVLREAFDNRQRLRARYSVD